MTLSLHQPATVMDLAACAPAVTLDVWGRAQAQVKLGPSWALRDPSGEAVACGGFAENGRGLAEGWFLAGPKARRHMLAIVRVMQRVHGKRPPEQVRGLPHGDKVTGGSLTGSTVAYRRRIVFVTTPEGRRIAEACGYRRIAASNGMEIYQWQD